MLRALAKRNRKRRQYDMSIKRSLNIALQLAGQEPAEDLQVEWGDGVPVDPSEKAEIREVNLRAGAMSTEAAVRDRMGDAPEEAIDEEIARVKKEKGMATLDNAENNPPKVSLMPKERTESETEEE